jgi:hypothetical protein
MVIWPVRRKIPVWKQGGPMRGQIAVSFRLLSEIKGIWNLDWPIAKDSGIDDPAAPQNLSGWNSTAIAKMYGCRRGLLLDTHGRVWRGTGGYVAGGEWETCPCRLDGLFLSSCR